MKVGILRDTNNMIGKRYETVICDTCKLKITQEMKNTNKLMLFRPKKLALKFQALLCDECRDKLINKIKYGDV